MHFYDYEEVVNFIKKVGVSKIYELLIFEAMVDLIVVIANLIVLNENILLDIVMVLFYVVKRNKVIEVYSDLLN